MDQDPGDQRRASLRASDADRERFVEALSQHHADGRLTTAPGGPRPRRTCSVRSSGTACSASC
jgi:hypothetical protein